MSDRLKKQHAGAAEASPAEEGRQMLTADLERDMADLQSGRLSTITIKVYQIDSISSEPVLQDTIKTPYIHYLAYVLHSGASVLFWEDPTTMLLYCVPSDIHGIAILACELAHKEDERRSTIEELKPEGMGHE